MHTETIVYKTVESHPIYADIHWEDSTTPLPIILFIHGGGLMMGSRKILLGDELSLLVNSGYAVIPIDYRLAPVIKLPEIITDVPRRRQLDLGERHARAQNGIFPQRRGTVRGFPQHLRKHGYGWAIPVLYILPGHGGMAHRSL